MNVKQNAPIEFAIADYDHNAAAFPLDTGMEGWFWDHLDVIPLRRNEKTPLTAHGYKDASHDREQVWKWRSAFGPDFGAVPESVRCIVVDVDPRNGGHESLDVLEREHGSFATAKMLTGGGGFHFWFLWPEDTPYPRTIASLFPGIDLKAKGGYVKIQGGHPSGGSYGWIIRPPAVAEAPGWLMAAIAAYRPAPPPATRRREQAVAVGPDEAVPNGMRNGWMFRQAIRDYHLGMTREKAFSDLTELNRTALESPLPEGELRSLLDAYTRYGPPQGAPLAFATEEWVQQGQTPAGEQCGLWAAIAHDAGEESHVRTYLKGCRKLRCTCVSCREAAVRRQARKISKALKGARVVVGTFWDIEGGTAWAKAPERRKRAWDELRARLKRLGALKAFAAFQPWGCGRPHCARGPHFHFVASSDRIDTLPGFELGADWSWGSIARDDVPDFSAIVVRGAVLPSLYTGVRGDVFRALIQGAKKGGGGAAAAAPKAAEEQRGWCSLCQKVVPKAEWFPCRLENPELVGIGNTIRVRKGELEHLRATSWWSGDTRRMAERMELTGAWE